MKKKYAWKDKPKSYFGYAFDEDINKTRFNKYKKQRDKRGFDDTELWNLDHTIAQYIYPRLKAFSDFGHGNPMGLTSDQWNKIIDKMLVAFELIINQDDSKYNREEWKIRDAKIEEGLALFAKYFRNLWD